MMLLAYSVKKHHMWSSNDQCSEPLSFDSTKVLLVIRGQRLIPLRKGYICMNPVSLALITAIGAGVTSSVTDATKASLVAGYTALKKRVLEKISSVHPKIPQALAELEAAPASQARQAVLVEEVAAAQLSHDPELLHLAQALLQ